MCRATNDIFYSSTSADDLPTNAGEVATATVNIPTDKFLTLGEVRQVATGVLLPSITDKAETTGDDPVATIAGQL